MRFKYCKLRFLDLKLDNHSSQTNKFVELRVNIPGEDVAVGKKSESFVGEGSHRSCGGQEGLHEGEGVHQEEPVEVLRSRSI